MNTHKQLNETLLPSLELTGIKNDEYLIVGSAGEFIGGYVDKFGDVDILVGPETFQRLIDNNFVCVYGDELETPVRIVRIGHLDIIEHHGDWLKAEKDKTYNLPILKCYDLVEWRIQMGRPKDQLKAWQLIHTIYADLRSVLACDPPLSMLVKLKTSEQQMFDYQKRLMDLSK